MENIYHANSNWKKIKAKKMENWICFSNITWTRFESKDSNIDKTIINSSKGHGP